MFFKLIFYLIFLFFYISSFAKDIPCPIGREIYLAQGSWESIKINNAIHSILLATGLKCKVKMVSNEDSDVFDLLINEKADYLTETWLQDVEKKWKKAIKNKKVVNLATNFISTQGWYIPDYTQIKHPKLLNISDLADFHNIFKYPSDTDKPPFYIGEKKYVSTKINISKIEKYGLKNYFNIVYNEHKKLEEIVFDSINQRKNIVFFSWSPSALVSSFRLRKLEENGCLSLKIDNNASNTSEAELPDSCDHGSSEVIISARKNFADNNPELVYIIKRAWLGNKVISELIKYMYEYNISAKQCAEYFFRNYKDEWIKKWDMPDYVVSRIKKQYNIR